MWRNKARTHARTHAHTHAHTHKRTDRQTDLNTFLTYCTDLSAHSSCQKPKTLVWSEGTYESCVGCVWMIDGSSSLTRPGPTDWTLRPGKAAHLALSNQCAPVSPAITDTHSGRSPRWQSPKRPLRWSVAWTFLHHANFKDHHLKTEANGLKTVIVCTVSEYVT